jgi:Spy/CpxP family protein refolding chaperone
MKKWHIILGVALIFLAGMIAGAGAARLIVKSRIEKAIDGGPDAIRELVMRRLTRELKLTAEQRPKIEEAIKDTQARMTRLRAVYQPEFETVIVDGIARMEPALTPEQQEKLRALHREAQARWQIRPR